MIAVFWTGSAIAGLGQIQAYIQQFNPEAARQIISSLRSAGDTLSIFPHRGRIVRGLPGTRELVSRYPYIIRYAIVRGDVFILRVRHGARRPTVP